MSETSLPAVAAHGANRLPSVDLDSYNVELKDDEGFIGDRASKGAFRGIIENWRDALRKLGEDPLGEDESEELTKKKLDDLLTKGDPKAAGIVQAAMDEFSQEFALVIRRFLKIKEWKDTQRIVVGGGFRASRVGELVIGRTAVILAAEKIDIDLVAIHNNPDEAGLMGAVHLAPSWMFKAFDAVLGVDIGGTNMRAGVVQLNLKKAPDLTKSKVWKFSLWRHGDEEGVKREHAVESLVEMLKGTSNNDDFVVGSTTPAARRLFPLLIWRECVSAFCGRCPVQGPSAGLLRYAAATIRSSVTSRRML